MSIIHGVITHLSIDPGFMTKQELEMHVSVPSTEFNTFWIPCTWFINLLREARQECRITDSSGLKLIMEVCWEIPNQSIHPTNMLISCSKEFNEFRSKCGLLWSYDWVSIPLVYTQVRMNIETLNKSVTIRLL